MPTIFLVSYHFFFPLPPPLFSPLFSFHRRQIPLSKSIFLCTLCCMFFVCVFIVLKRK